MEEIWKPVVGYEWLYEVSNLGNIRSLSYNKRFNKEDKTIKNLKPWKTHDWYYIIGLSKNQKQKTYRLHRLIAQVFLPNPENKPQINHKDGIRDNNKIENLEWCTQSENAQHSYRELWRKYWWSGKEWELHWRSRCVWQFTLDWILIKRRKWIRFMERELWYGENVVYYYIRSKIYIYDWYMWKYI